MMSKKQWFVLLCIFVIYLMLGAGIFFNVESQEEAKRMENSKIERRDVEELLDKLVNKSVPIRIEKELLNQLSDYCGKPIAHGMKDLDFERHWDFYHSLFFVITVVSTIGYGNLAPTTMFGRIFMIFYGLIGIPINGILMVSLGNFFGRSFSKLYKRWKHSKVKYDAARLGLIGQVILYLVPGFTFFIFLPSGIMVLFEGWEYDVAVYYCFVTLTTIGFGDYVAGVDNANEFSHFWFWIYKIFLLVWVIGGLGYVVMVLGYITQAMQSKKIQEIEQIITQNIKKTPIRIRQELRTLLQEFLFLKVKQVYKGDFDYIPTQLERSQSCPDLTAYHQTPSAIRKRALSECPTHFSLNQSDSKLNMIDKEQAFFQQPSGPEFMQQSQLIQQVVNALANEINNELNTEEGGYHNFTDSQILESERYGSKLSLRSQSQYSAPPTNVARRRAVSDIRVPSMVKVNPDPWSDVHNLPGYRSRNISESSSDKESDFRGTQNILTRFKNRFFAPASNRLDVERSGATQNRRASMFTTNADRYLRNTSHGRPSVVSLEQQEAVLEQTSIADFIRALTAITVPEEMIQTQIPKRKVGNAGLIAPTSVAPLRTRRQAIRPNTHARRTSLMPSESPGGAHERRRFSLRPVDENYLTPPPPYSAPTNEIDRPIVTRRFSRVNIPSISISPVVRHLNKRENSST